MYSLSCDVNDGNIYLIKIEMWSTLQNLQYSGLRLWCLHFIYFIFCRYYRYSYRSPYRCYCSTCVRYRLYRPYSYLYKYRPCRFSCYPYRPLHHYTRTYLDSCDLLDDDDLNPRSSYKLPKLKVTSSNPKDGTSEDSDLLDGSQVEEIQRGMNKKSQSSKQESWTKSKVKMGDASGDSAAGGRERQHEEGKAPSKEGGLGKESQSSGEFFDLD